MDILNIVVQPTWREFLVELITTNQMDPWDIDVGAVAEAYLAKVRELQALDLRVPANVILASALLLHFKANSLNLEQAFAEEEAPAEEEVRPLVSEDVPELVFNPNIPKSRRLTLEELMNAVEQVMASGKIRPRSRAAPQELEVQLPKEDMHEFMERFYRKAGELKDSEGVLLFSQLIGERSADAIANHILPMLHLVQENRLAAWQDELFGEIFIKYLEPTALLDAKPAEPDGSQPAAVAAAV